MNDKIKDEWKISSQKKAFFVVELEALINKYSLENESDTPDFILAQYLMDCLEVYEKTVKRRDRWYNFKGLKDIIKEEAI